MATAKYLDAGKQMIQLIHDNGNAESGATDVMLEKCLRLGLTPVAADAPPAKVNIKADAEAKLVKYPEVVEALKILGIL